MEQFRTTVSAVFWTETPDVSAAIVAAVAALLPPEDQTATLATIEYIADGRPTAANPPSGVL